jgi:hypothetical protein
MRVFFGLLTVAAFEGWCNCERNVQSRPLARLTARKHCTMTVYCATLAPCRPGRSDGIHTLGVCDRRLRQRASSPDKQLQPSFSRSPSSYLVYRQRRAIRDWPLGTLDSLFRHPCLPARLPKIPCFSSRQSGDRAPSVEYLRAFRRPNDGCHSRKSLQNSLIAGNFSGRPVRIGLGPQPRAPALFASAHRDRGQVL